MKKIADYLFLIVVLFALQSCSNDDEPKHVDTELLSGEWYITNIHGWEYRNDAHDKKSEFNETFNFNGQGIPVGSNMIDAQKVRFSVNSFDSESGCTIYLEYCREGCLARSLSDMSCHFQIQLSQIDFAKAESA